jgi:hypothetical protein
MVEEKNMEFLNLLHGAVEKLDATGDWQEAYESFLRAGRQPGGFLEQLERAHETAEVCPGSACDAESGPQVVGCPHIHPGEARWAPDGSLLGVITRPNEELSEDPDTLIIDHDCSHSH